MDLSGAYLDRAHLKEVQWGNANLRGAHLDGADLTGSYITADFTGATVAGIILTDCDLTGSTWVDGTKCGTGSYGRCVKEGLKNKK